MGEVRRCDECGGPYRTSWRDPGMCAACVLDNFKRTVREEMIEPWAIPVLEWLNERLRAVREVDDG